MKQEWNIVIFCVQDYFNTLQQGGQSSSYCTFSTNPWCFVFAGKELQGKEKVLLQEPKEGTGLEQRKHFTQIPSQIVYAQTLIP